MSLCIFAEFIDGFKDEQSEGGSRKFVYQLIVEKRVQGSFPNVAIALSVYLVLLVSNNTRLRSAHLQR